MAAVEIAIPPRSVYVAVVRLAVASLARTAGLDEDRVDDLRIAVSEACTNAVLAHEEAGRSEPVVVAWDDQPDQLVIEVRGHVPAPDSPSEDSEGFSSRSVLSRALLESLVDSTEHSETGARLTINR